jgi:hypothetical protein
VCVCVCVCVCVSVRKRVCNVISSTLRSLKFYTLRRKEICKFYLSMALQPFVKSLPLFQFLNPIHNRKDSLDGE